MFLTVSQIQCIIYRPDFHNSQASRKKLKKYLIVETKPGINDKTNNTFLIYRKYV